MQRVIIIDKNGMRDGAFGRLDLLALYSVCCKDTPSNEIVELARGRFSDKKIDIWCHEEGRLIPLPVTALLRRTNEDFCGPLLICGSRGSKSIGLTDAQVEIVKAQIIPVGDIFIEPTPPSANVSSLEVRLDS